MSPTVLFSQVNKEVVVTDVASGTVLWSGKPLGRPVLDLVQLSHTGRAIALLDSFNAPRDQRDNLVAIDELGSVLWSVNPPTTDSTDAWTEMEVLDEGVSAFSWSGHRVLIDTESGTVLDDNFTK